MAKISLPAKKTAAKKAVARKTAVKKTTAARTTAAKTAAKKPTRAPRTVVEFTETQARKIAKLRKGGMDWLDIGNEFGTTNIHKLRAAAKSVDPSTVRAIGRGAGSYGSGNGKTAAKKPTAKKTAAKGGSARTATKGGGRPKAPTASGDRGLLEKVWNLDTPEDEIRGILTGARIVLDRSVEGIRMAPESIKISRVKKIAPGKTGKVIEVMDTELKDRIFNFADIAEVHSAR
jgi:hypothetical protein